MRGLIAACAAGVVAALGQAPLGWWWAMMAGLVVFGWLWSKAHSPRRGALLGWMFGLGYFGWALRWIVEPFLVEPEIYGWMAPFALVFMAGGLALFWGAAAWGARRLRVGGTATLALCFALGELARAYVFTGFPWAMVAYGWLDTPVAGVAALVSPYGLNALTFLAAFRAGRSGRSGVPALPAAALAGAALLVPMPESQPPQKDAPVVRLLQPNAAQHLKWHPNHISTFYQRQISYTAAPATPRPALIVWPETALPSLLEESGRSLARIAEAAGEAWVVVGVQRSDADGYYNTLAVLDPGGAISAVYDKHHLVPFGEYMPLRDWVARLGIYGLAARADGGYRPGPGPRSLSFGALGTGLPLICYEAVFPQDTRLPAGSPRPSFLLQITNDAWFGQGAGPAQHLAQARMRALELGLPALRSANTGISAMIGPRGEIMAHLPLGEAGFLDAPLPAPLAPTLYSRTGDWPVAIMLLLALVVLAIGRKTRSPH